MQNSSQTVIRELYHSLLGIGKVFDEEAKNRNVDSSLVMEYERFLDDAAKQIQGKLSPFNRNEYFSHDDRSHGGGIYYKIAGIKAHIARNLGTLKAQVDQTAESPALKIKGFNFVKDSTLTSILERDYLEIQRNLISDNWKSTILLCGGSIEAILLDLLSSNSAAVDASIKRPKEPDLRRWDLNDLIEVGVDSGLVGKELAKLSHSVREYRNLIHPGVEVRSGLKVEPEEARIAVEVLNILIRELS